MSNHNKKCCCGKTECCPECERPGTMAYVESVSLNIDPTTNELYAIVNGTESNRITYNSGGADVNIEEIEIPIESFNQTLFSQVIPVGKTFLSLSVNGIEYNEGSVEDFILTGAGGRDINWISTLFPLTTTDTLKIYVY